MCVIDFNGNLSRDIKLVDRSSGAKEPMQVQIIASTPLALGLKWEKIGPERPPMGTEIGNIALGEALQQKIQFTQVEFDRFKVSSILHNSYAMAGGMYFTPEQTPLSEKLEKTILDTDKEGDQSTIATRWQTDSLTTDQMRVVLVCMDHSFSYAYIVENAADLLNHTANRVESHEVSTVLQHLVADAKTGLAVEQKYDEVIRETGDKITELKAEMNMIKSRRLEDLRNISRDVSTAGLQWEVVNLKMAKSGIQITNKGLVTAMKQLVEEDGGWWVEEEGREEKNFEFTFIEEELIAFGLAELSYNSYVKVDENYFRTSALEATTAQQMKAEAARKQIFIDQPALNELIKIETDLHKLAELSSDLTKLIMPFQNFRAAVAAGLVIILVICPSYVITDYGCWWPANMPEMQKHALFVDLRNVSDWPQKVKKELLEQVEKFLEEWRGKAPDPSAFAAAADCIMCVQCSENSMSFPHIFSRLDCESKLEKRRTQINVLNEEAHTAGLAEQDHSEMLQDACLHDHRTTLTDILSKKVILEAVACPSCVQNGQLPPHCYNRQECLLYFSEDMLRGSRTGSLQCPLCAKSGRASAIRILDAVAPEIFISYNWGCNNSTQERVKPLRVRIEQDADVVMWFDVGGGMGAGMSVKAEMEQGVLKSTVVLIFISDAYCDSENCKRKFIHATKHSKFLIVCLTPSGGRTCTGDSGWTDPGPEDEDWWHHATKMSSCKDPDTGKPFSWSSLGPIRAN